MVTLFVEKLVVYLCTSGKAVVQLKHGLHSEIQDDLGGDGGASMLQRGKQGGADGARGIGVIGERTFEANARGAKNYRRREAAAV